MRIGGAIPCGAARKSCTTPGANPCSSDRLFSQSRSRLGKILVFAAVLEIGTGLVLMIDPAIVVRLLLGPDVSGVGVMVGRCFGITLVALGLACWPGTANGAPAFRAMLTYNAFIALYLAYLGTIEKMAGMLLWPGVALHAAVALLLLRAWRLERRT